MIVKKMQLQLELLLLVVVVVIGVATVVAMFVQEQEDLNLSEWTTHHKGNTSNLNQLLQNQTTSTLSWQDVFLSQCSTEYETTTQAPSAFAGGVVFTLSAGMFIALLQ
jgi:uncharacterized protein (UPF0333 family)